LIEDARQQFGVARRIIRPSVPSPSNGGSSEAGPTHVCHADGCPWDILGARSGHWRGILHRGAGVSIGYTRCRPTDDCRGPEHLVGANVITFPRSGVFVMHVGGETYIADPNCTVFSNRFDTFRTSHPGGHGDDTLWLAVDPGVVTEAVSAFDPAAAQRPDHPFPFTHGPCEPRTYLMHQALFRDAARTRTPDPVRLDEAACALVHQAIAGAFSARGIRPARSRAGTDAAHRRAVERTRQMLAVRFRERLTIGEIASEACVSPFHLCRIFRRHAGLPIHRYLNRLRLRAAVERLLEGEEHLADLASDVGFASHSHFSDAFRREFGVPPSTVRSRLTGVA
jgi:AraC family transcriptional regulator